MIRHVYIHIPFCTRKCGYCSFYSEPYKIDEVNPYISLLVKEIELYKNILSIKPDTLYIGGGTPNLLTASQLAEILFSFDLSRLKECTIELNPNSIDKHYIENLRDLPVNRISLGAQSFDDAYLRLLGRNHVADKTFEVFELLRENGFSNISLDLMYGAKLESMTAKDEEKFTKKVLQKNIKAVEKLKPEHVSCYCLSLKNSRYAQENCTANTVDVSGPVLSEASDEICSASYRFLCDRLENRGLKQYEISSFAKPDKESKHNMSYWTLEEYLGLGAAAHGFIGSIRYNNPCSINLYKENIAGYAAYPGKKEQTETGIISDYVIQGLRLTKGINLKIFQQRFGKDFFELYRKTLARYSEFLEIDRNEVKLKRESYFVSNEILAGFLL